MTLQRRQPRFIPVWHGTARQSLPLAAISVASCSHAVVWRRTVCSFSRLPPGFCMRDKSDRRQISISPEDQRLPTFQTPPSRFCVRQQHGTANWHSSPEKLGRRCRWAWPSCSRLDVAGLQTTSSVAHTRCTAEIAGAHSLARPALQQHWRH